MPSYGRMQRVLPSCVTLIIQNLNVTAGLDPDVCMFLCDSWGHIWKLEHLVHPVCKPSLYAKTNQKPFCTQNLTVILLIWNKLILMAFDIVSYGAMCYSNLKAN